MEIFDLTHHLLIDCQTTRGIHQQNIVRTTAGSIDRAFSDIDRFFICRRWVKASTDFIRQSFKLFDRRRTIHVRRNHHHFLFLSLSKILRKLTNGRCFTCALQTRHHHDGWRLCRQVQFFVGFAHDTLQFFMDDFQEYLPRVEALQYIGTDSTLFDLRGKIFYDRQGHVGFQQRHAHFTHGAFDILFGQLRLASNAF